MTRDSLVLVVVNLDEPEGAPDYVAVCEDYEEATHLRDDLVQQLTEAGIDLFQVTLRIASTPKAVRRYVFDTIRSREVDRLTCIEDTEADTRVD